VPLWSTSVVRCTLCGFTHLPVTADSMLGSLTLYRGAMAAMSPSLVCLPTRSLTHSLNHSLTHALTRARTHSLLTFALTYAHTQFLLALPLSGFHVARAVVNLAGRGVCHVTQASRSRTPWTRPSRASRRMPTSAPR
jgi:hypothetical protein